MKICMKHTTVSKGWLRKLKGSWRLKVSNSGIKFWTRSLGKKCEMLFSYKLVNPLWHMCSVGKRDMVKEKMVMIGFNKDNQCTQPFNRKLNNNMGNQTNLLHKSLRVFERKSNTIIIILETTIIGCELLDLWTKSLEKWLFI